MVGQCFDGPRNVFSGLCDTTCENPVGMGRFVQQRLVGLHSRARRCGWRSVWILSPIDSRGSANSSCRHQLRFVQVPNVELGANVSVVCGFAVPTDCFGEVLRNTTADVALGSSITLNHGWRASPHRSSLKMAAIPSHTLAKAPFGALQELGSPAISVRA